MRKNSANTTVELFLITLFSVPPRAGESNTFGGVCIVLGYGVLNKTKTVICQNLMWLKVHVQRKHIVTFGYAR